MADDAAEAAFLDAMRAQNDAAGEQEAYGAASQQQTESVSDDEYDPAAEMRAESLPTDAQDPALHDPSSSAVQPFSHYTPPPATLAAYDDAQGSDQSRSMSPDSTQSVPGIPTIISQPQGDSIHDPYGPEEGAISVEKGEAILPNGQTPGQASPNISNVLLGSLPTDQVTIQNDVQGVLSTENLQNSVVPSTSNVSTSLLADGGAALSGKSIVEQSAPAPAPEQHTKQKAESAPVTATAVPKARLPHDRIGILEDRIQADPRGDHDAWLSLISEHRQRGKLADARKVYERFFEIFPAAAEQWVAYAKMENEAGERLKMEGIFNRTLMTLPHLQLWSMYVDHIRRVHNTVTDTSGTARQTIHQAYQFALDHVGIDKEAGRLWQEYIQFLKSWPGTVGGSNWQDQQKMDELRKAYQRAICIPNQAVTAIWKEYDQFENGLNKVTGRKFLQERSPSYMTARSENIQLQTNTRNLRRTTLPVLPPAPGYEGYEQYMEQVAMWNHWIEWEKTDPLLIMSEDIEAYRDRVVFVYKQALMALRFWPELWVDAVDFCFSNNKDELGDELLSKGVEANPESCLLAFKKADRYELTTTGEEGDAAAIRRGKALKDIYKMLLDALYEALAKEKAREAQLIARIEEQYSNQVQQSLVKGRDDEQETNEEDIAELEKHKAQHMEAVKATSAEYVYGLKKTISHSWIAYMRSMRRVQGKGRPKDDDLGGSRLVFGEARKRGQITTELYIESAYIEFHCYDPEVARKIFERGLKLYASDEQLALEYIKHLTNTNDHTNARVTFETVVAKLLSKPETKAKAKPLFAFFHDFESRYGELSGITKLEARMREHFPEDPTLALFSQRFIAPGFDPRAVRVIVSPAAQTRPKILPVPSIEAPPPTETSPPKPNSPKRPLPLEESDTEGNRPRKIMREASPLKGAAGRRLDQQRRARQNETPHLDGSSSAYPHPPPLPNQISFLISILPKAQIFNDSRPINISPTKAIQLLQTLHIPGSVAELEQITRPRTAPINMSHSVPQPLQHPPPMPQHVAYAQHMQPMPPMPPQQHSQYNSGYPVFPSQSVPPQDPRFGFMQNGGGRDPRLDYSQGSVSQAQASPTWDSRGPPSAVAGPPPMQDMSSQNPFGPRTYTCEEASTLINEMDKQLRDIDAKFGSFLSQPRALPSLTFN